MEDEPLIHGECDPWFSGVQDAFQQMFADGSELGASVCVILDGRIVVDLWGGWASRSPRAPWHRDTLVNCYSATKGVSALCVHRLAEDGLLDLSCPVAQYWPEFRQAGKERVTVEQVLSHQAGLAALDTPLGHDALYSHSTMARALAAQAPSYSPGTAHSYHAQTFGFLVGEVVRRVTGRSLGRYFAEEVAEPREIDFRIGFGPEHDGRIAQMTRPLGVQPPPGQPDLVAVFGREPDSLTARAFRNPKPQPGAVNSRAYRAAEMPGSNGHGTARGLAQVYGAAIGAWGEPWLSPTALARCSEPIVDGMDEVLRVPTCFSQGFMVSRDTVAGRMGRGASPRAFGHPGMGGTLGCADPDIGLAFGFTVNRAAASVLVDPRASRLLDATYLAL